jgi:hypothetical protein
MDDFDLAVAALIATVLLKERGELSAMDLTVKQCREKLRKLYDEKRKS